MQGLSKPSGKNYCKVSEMCKSIPAGFDFDLVLHIKNAHSQENNRVILIMKAARIWRGCSHRF